jgi:hypothetical protein
VPEPGLVLAMSGGGFHATLFHIGVGRRLLEVGVLTQLKRFSSISGGSIYAGILASLWDALSRNPTLETYPRLVVDPLRQICRQDVDTVSIGESQPRGLRKRALIDDFTRGVRSGSTYRGESGKYQLPAGQAALPCADAVVKPLAVIRIRLNPFSDEEQEQLINWGYALCDAAIRAHVPQIIRAASAPQWPFPAHPLG